MIAIILQFIKHIIGIILFVLGLAGSILPILPGFLLIIIALKLLEDINFFKLIKDKLVKNIDNIKNYTLSLIKNIG